MGDPELQKALQGYADGDRVGAFPVVEQILEVNAARQRKVGTRMDAAQTPLYGSRAP